MKNISTLLIAVAVAFCGMSFAQDANTVVPDKAPAVHRQCKAHNGARHARHFHKGRQHRLFAYVHKHGKSFCFGRQDRRHCQRHRGFRQGFVGRPLFKGGFHSHRHAWGLRWHRRGK